MTPGPLALHPALARWLLYTTAYVGAVVVGVVLAVVLCTIAAAALYPVLNVARRRSPEAARRPEPIPGLTEATGRDAWRIVAWTWRGYRHGARRPGPQRIPSTLMAATMPLAWPALVVTTWGRLHDPRGRTWITPTATIAVEATRTGRKVFNHLSAHPGRAASKTEREDRRALQRAVATAQLAYVENGGRIDLSAASPRLAEVYTARYECQPLGTTLHGSTRMTYAPETPDENA